MTTGYIDIGAKSVRILLPIYEEGELVETIVHNDRVTGRGKEGFLNEDTLKNELKQITENLRKELDVSNLPPCCVTVKDSEAITEVRSLSVRADGKTIAKSDVLYIKRNIDLEYPDHYVALHRIPIGFRFDDGELIQDPVGQSGDVLSFYVMLIAVRHEELETYAYLMRKSGVKVHRYLYDGIAHGLAAIRETKETTCTVVDLGVNTTGLIAFEGGVPVHLGSLPYGMELLSSELVRQMKCSGDTADSLLASKGMAARGSAIKYKLSDGKSSGAFDVPQFVNMLRLKMNTILQAVRTEISNSEWPNGEPNYRQKVVFTGGGRGLSDLTRVSQQLLKVETTVARGSRHTEDDDAFMACLGMLMYMSGDDFNEAEFAKMAKISGVSSGGAWQWVKGIFS